MEEIVVLTTADSRELAKKIAVSLVESGAAACVNLMEGIRSIYRWQGELCEEDEFLLLIKSTKDCFETIRSMIRELHSYDVPEVVALSLSGGDPDYLRWLGEQVSPAGG